MNEQKQFMKTIFTLRASLLLAFILMVSVQGHAQNFTQGNIVVSRVGDGTTAIVSGGVSLPVELVEYDPSAATPVPLKTVALNNGTGTKLTLGTLNGEGQLKLSQDGRFITLLGYNSATGIGLAGSGQNASNNHRWANTTLGRIAFDGTVNYNSYAPSTTGSSVRSAVSIDGSTAFTKTSFNTAASNVLNVNTTTSAVTAVATFGNTAVRTLELFSSILFTGAATHTFTYSSTVTSNSTTGVTSTALPIDATGRTGASSLCGFVFLDSENNSNSNSSWNGTGLDLLYVADQSGGIYKYYWDGTNFKYVSVYYVSTTLTPSNITGRINAAGKPELFYTTGNGATANNSLYMLTDARTRGLAFDPTVKVIATGAGSNYAFRGVAFAPSSVAGAPTIGTAAVTGVSGRASVAFTAPASNGGATITSYTATSLPGGITGTLSQSGSGTIIIDGLTNGTAYTFTVTATNNMGTSVASAASNSVTPFASTTWNGTTWSNGVPTASVDAIINSTYSTTSGAITAKSLTVNATTGNLTIASNTNVTVQNAVVNNGILTIQNNANLIQVNNVTNSGSGTTTVYRNGGDLKRLDYTLWSSPVAPNQTLKGFSGLTVDPRFYQYLESSNKYNAVDPAATTFATGKGYLIRMPDEYPLNSGNQTAYYIGNTTLAYPGAFAGTLNNGNIPITLTKTDALKGYQAVGNPYPSVIKAQEFVTANTANIENTLYFWRKTNGAGGSAYATWTSGGSTTNEIGVEEPNGKIQVGQGFIVRAKDSGTVTDFFTNAMREEAPSSTQFFKTKQQAQKDRMWLNLTNTSGAFSQALVVYIEGATVGLDQYDGKYINDSNFALTTSINNVEYTIQGRPAFDATDVVAINFKTSVAGTYTIAIDHVDGLFSNGQDIYLVDKTTGVSTNLNEGAYTFTAAVGVDNTRFTLTYQKTLKIDAPLFNENSVLVSRNNGTLNVKSSAVAINNIKVYDVQGRLVAERKNVKSNTASISNLRTNQVLIVKVTSENNAVVTKKVLN